METEYIRGKFQERNGALTSRAPAQFDARGNDVWAHRSGRTYQPAVGGAMDYSSPVTGNGMEHGMGNLARLVGGKHLRRGVGMGITDFGIRDTGIRDIQPGEGMKRGVGRGLIPGGKKVALPGFGQIKGSGSDLMMSPQDAQRLMMMDYRGGRHPYLTKSGSVRSHLKGSGIWDSIKDIAKKGYNQLADPNSTLRGVIAPGVAAVAGLAGHPELAKAATALNKGEWAALGAQAKGAYDKYNSAQSKGSPRKAGEQLGEVASRLKGGPKPTSFMTSMTPYSVEEPEDDAGPVKIPNFLNKPRAAKDSNGYPLAIMDKPRGRLALEDRPSMMMLEDKPRGRLALEDRPGMLMLEDAPKPKRKSRVEALQEKFARQAAMRGHGTPDYATLLALQRGANQGGAKPKRSNKRGQMVGKIMRERGVSLPEASRIVKAEGLA